MEQQDHPQTAGPSGDHQVAPGVKAKEEDMKEEEMETTESSSMAVGGEEQSLKVEEMEVEDCKAALHGDEACRTENKPAVRRNHSRPPVAVEFLLSQPFAQRSSVEKTDILARGRPTPDIDLSNHLDNEILRFDSTHYNSKPWLTGCPKANKLFCWPCLLFSSETSVWTTGFGDLKNLQRDALEHEHTLQHIGSQVQVCTYSHARHRRMEPGSKRARLTMDELYNVKSDSETDSESDIPEPEEERTREPLQNAEEVRAFVLKLLTNTVVFLGGTGQCLQAPVHEEEEDDTRDDEEDSSSSAKPTSGFKDLVWLFMGFCEKLNPHIDTKSTLSGMTIQHQNNLVESVGEVLLKEIKAEIKGAIFVSLILHETSLGLHDPQLATILRYVTKDGFAVERFVGFVPEGLRIYTAEGLTEYVLTLLQKMDCADKMAALSYGGQAVTSKHISGHVAMVKERYPWVNFVHWYASETNTALADASGDGMFFGVLHTLGEFFTASFRSPGRVRALKEIISKRGVSSTVPLLWKKKSDLVKTVREYRESLLELRDDIDENPEEWDSSTMFCSWMFKDLEDPEFLFLLEVFSAVFHRTDAFVSTLQRMVLKTGSGVKALKRTLDVLKAMHGDFDTIFSQGIQQVDDPTQTSKWEEESRDDFRELYACVLDAATSELAMRFESLAKLTFTELLSVSRFQVYKKSFPENAFNCLKDSYGNFFDLALLRSELEVVYSSPELKKKNFYEFGVFLHSAGLNSNLPQVSKLCELIQVLPLSSTKKQRGFNAVSRRIEWFGDVSTGGGTWAGQRMKGRVPSVALMAVEKKMLRVIAKVEGFDERVARIFEQKEPRLDLVSV